MLNAFYAYRSKGRGKDARTHITEREKSRNVDELLSVVDRFIEMGSDVNGRFPPGADGDHAWMSIVDRGFVVHAYFGRNVIRFELYGPTPTGREKEHRNPYDGSGLSGELNAETLKGLFKLLDRGQSPWEFVLANAEK